MKEYNKHQTQLRLEAFYSFNERFAKVRSQRIKKALKGITGKSSANVVSDDEIGHTAVHESERNGKSAKKASKKPKRQRIGSEKTQSDSDIISKCDSTSGRQRKRGRGKGKRDVTDNSTEKDSSDDSGNNGLPTDDVPATLVTRRSARRRSKVKYTEEEAEENVGADMDHETKNIGKRQDPMKQQYNVTEENEPNNKGDNSYNPGIDLLPKTDYLMSGGGFCMDENEEEGDDAPRPVTNSPVINFLTEGGFCREENQEDDCMEESGERKSQMMNEKGEVDLGLRAMPSLRKKRKKV